MKNQNNFRITPRIDRPADYQGSRHSVLNQAEGEKLASGSNSQTNGLLVNQNLDNPNPELTEPSQIKRTATKRHKWTREEYEQVLTAYYTALHKPERNITNQTYEIWRDLVGFNRHQNMDANKLGNTRRYAEKTLSSAEIERIRSNVNGNPDPPTNCTNQNDAVVEQETIIESPNMTNDDSETRTTEPCPEVICNILREFSIAKQLDMDSRDYLPKIPISKRNMEIIDMHNTALAHILKENGKDVTNLNHLIYATAKSATKSIGISTNKNAKKYKRSEPKWKAKIRREIDSLRGELSILTELADGRNVKTRKGRKVRRKYDIKNEANINVAKEVLKQRISVKSQRLRRYEKRERFFRQNRMFTTDTKKLYREIDNQRIQVKKPPNLRELENFWTEIWRGDDKFNENAAWLKREKERLNSVDRQQWEEILVEEVKATLKKAHKWKSPGRDKIPNFWLNSLSTTHIHLTKYLTEIMQNPNEMPPWLSEGITFLIPKNQKTEDPKNYRPITCLTTTYKLLTAILSDRIYSYLEEKDILPTEQKGCRKNCYGCKDQLLINKMIIESCKKKHRNLSAAWIDYRKAFDSVPHKWILKALDIYGISPTITNFLQQAMTQWNTKLSITHANGTDMSGSIPIDRGIFQGDSLSPLLFCLALIPVSHELSNTGYGYRIFNQVISHLLYMDDLKLYAKNDDQLKGLLETVKRFSDDIGMEFGLDKCAKVTFKRGKITSTSHINLDIDTQIKELEQEGIYKYLGIDEGDGIPHGKMKDKVRKEYYRRIRLVLKTELNSKNKIQAINALAVPVVLYSFNIIDWNIADVQRMDAKTRKLLTANRMHHPKADVDRIYLSRKQGGRGLTQLALLFKTTTIGLETYLQNTSDWMLRIVQKYDSNNKLHSTIKESELYRRELGTEIEPSNNQPTEAAKMVKHEAKRAAMKELKERWQEKPLHGQYPLRISEADVDEQGTHQWLRSSGLKGETEGFIMAAQDQSLNTRNYQANIIKNGINPMCRLCEDKVETIDHIVAGCSILAATEYKMRHDRIGQYLHWTICKHYDAPFARNWYEHHPEPVIEAESVTILWDFPIHTDRTIKANRPDIIVKDYKNGRCILIDMTVPSDRNVAPKEFEKLSKYKDLEIEIQ